MKKIILLFAALCAFTAAVHAQVGINAAGNPPDPAAGLDVDFTDKVFLPPRMTTEQRDAIVSPPSGSFIYNTDTNCMEYYRGVGNGGWFSMCPALPTVSTDNITSVTGVSASGGGNVLDDGGAAVIQRGICWSTSSNPTTGDFSTVDGSGIGSFSSALSGLSNGTTYYVRAYATNGVGTAYGDEVTFTTLDIPSVTTDAISNISGSAADGGGNVTADGGDAVTVRGLCWSTNPGPTTGDDFTSDGSGIGLFTSALSSLTPGTTYYVRAYATNSTGTAYGNEVTFETQAIYIFTTPGTTSWTAPEGVTSVEVLVVAGGGGGGQGRGGGGGAGGLIYESSYSVTPGNTYTVVVGSGGTGSTNSSVKGGNGGDSQFASLIATGGGGAGSDNVFHGLSGGSGGGGAGNGGGGNGGSGVSGQGYAGGQANDSFPAYAGAGGGGAGGAGQNGTSSAAGDGGPGVSISITGSPVYYAGGGGGGKYNEGSGGAGGIGGGGSGSPSLSEPALNAAPNTGGGGGGGAHLQSGGNGGSGIVIIK